MYDFTSSLYLGFRHPSASVRGWRALTTGVPAVLGEPDGALEVRHRLAELQGCEAATLFPSTLHAFWDLCGELATGRASFHVDAGAYAMARSGTERAIARALPVSAFRHYDPDALREQIDRTPGYQPPVVLTDGFCPACGRPAPLADYLDCVRTRRGWLIVDDTQALGVFGIPSVGFPYGRGGGGSLRRQGIAAPELLLVCSLAKAFGVPMAALSGDRAVVARFERNSSTRVHSSPICAAVVQAARSAFDINDREGDVLRRRLFENVRRFRAGVASIGYAAAGGPFPAQSLGPIRGVSSISLHACLLRDGIRAVLLGPGCGAPAPRSRSRVGFFLSAMTTDNAIARVIAAIARARRTYAA